MLTNLSTTSHFENCQDSVMVQMSLIYKMFPVQWSAENLLPGLHVSVEVDFMGLSSDGKWHYTVSATDGGPNVGSTGCATCIATHD